MNRVLADPLTPADVVGAHAGLRPLVAGSPSEGTLPEKCPGLPAAEDVAGRVLAKG